MKINAFSYKQKIVDLQNGSCKNIDHGAMPRLRELGMNGCQILSAIMRFERKLITMDNGCRVWNGAQTKGGLGRYKVKKHKDRKRLKGKPRPNGNNPAYGKFWVGPHKKNTVQAHVFAAFLAGKIPTLRVPDGFHLDHRCDHGTLCVDCTELVPAEVNLQRAREGRIGRADIPPPSQRRKPSRRRSRKPGNLKKVSPVAKNACTGQRNV